MIKRTVFLRWALFACFIALGAYIAWQRGWIALLERDVTHLPYLTLAFGVIGTLWCGRIAWQLSSGHDLDDLKIDLKLAHYAPVICVSLGMLGTGLGFRDMFSDSAAAGQAKEVIASTWHLAGIALLNTVTGMIAGLVLEVQARAIDYAVAKARKRARKAP